MFNIKTSIITFGLFIGSMVQASKTHLFYCSNTNTEPKIQVYFEIEDKNLDKGVGQIIISKFLDNASDNPRWEEQEQAEIKMNITWGSNNGRSIITGISSDMGRSGKIDAKMVGPIDNIDSSSGFIQSTLLSINAPKGIPAEYCTYFLSLGPKPGMTGSN